MMQEIPRYMYLKKSSQLERGHMKLRYALLVCLITGSNSVVAQNCATYKSQLESLLILPAGKYRIDGFYAKVPARAVKTVNGRHRAFDGDGYKDGLNAGDLITIKTYLAYTLPVLKAKITDSTTQGTRKINGRLACQYEVSLLDPPGRRQYGMDVEVSDSGRAKFFVKTMMSGDDPTRFALLSSELANIAVLTIAAESFRSRDGSSPIVLEAAERDYSERIAKAQAAQDSRITEYKVLERECASIVANGNDAIRNKDLDQHGYWRGRFTNGQCANTTLLYPNYP